MTSYLVSGPKVEPISIPEARSICRATAENDPYLVTLIAAARIHVESLVGRPLITQTWRLVMEDWPDGWTVLLPLKPVTELRARYYLADGRHQPMFPRLILSETGEVRFYRPRHPPTLRKRFPIEIDYAAGYGAHPADVPEKLRQALLTLVGCWFRGRCAPSQLPADFHATIEQHRRAA